MTSSLHLPGKLEAMPRGSKTFSVPEPICHARDIEPEGYSWSSLRALVHDLGSDDQQHVASLQWVTGTIASSV